MRLKDKVAIVTGASSGIGRAIALGFASEGAHIVVCYYSSQQRAQEVADKIEQCGRRALLCRINIACREDMERMAAETAAVFGRIDILVNNAGARDQASVTEVTPEVWQHAVDANLGGAFWAIRAAAPVMAAHGGGRIINIASLQGCRPCNEARSAYCTTKGGLLALTRAAAVELEPQGIRVNAISPGTIDTNMGGMKELFTPEVIEERCQYIPLRYRGKAEELVGPAVFLASDESSYVTGSNLLVDGGWCAGD